MEVIEKLEGMRGKPYEYQGETVTILNYCAGTGEDGDEVEIYLNNGKTLVFNYGNLLTRLMRFHELNNTVIVLANEKLNQVSTINPSVISELRDTVLDSIRKLKADPSTVKEAQQIFQGVSVLTNLAKTEIEYRKFLSQNNKQ